MTYYIDQYGSDTSGDGSLVAPWRTLSYACSRVTTAGDIIHVNAGIYTETSRCVLAAGVSIEGASEATAIINSTYAPSSFSDGVIYAVSSSVVNGNQSISYITLTGSSYTGTRGIYMRYRNNFHIHHCTIRNFDKSGINAYCEIDWVTPPAVFTTGFQVYNCTIIDNTESPDNGAECNLRFSGLVAYEIHNNTIDNSTRVAPRSVYSSQVKNGSFHDNILVTRETISGTWLFACELWNNRGGVDIYNNTFTGGGTLDIGGHTTQKGIYDYGVRIHDNTFTKASASPYDDTPYSAITIECWVGIEYAYVYNNIITNFAWGVTMTAGGGLGGSNIHDVFIHTNIIINPAHSNVSWAAFGIGVIQQTLGITRDNINILNNVIIGKSSTAWRGIVFSADGNNTDINIKNNIIHSITTYPIRFENSGNITNCAVDNNLVYNSGNGNAVSIQAGVVMVGYTNNNHLIGDPLFSGADDYHLQSVSSPAYHSGVDVGLTEDLDGYAWAVPSPSMGVYEFVPIKKLTTINIVGGRPVTLVAKPNWITVLNNADDSVINLGSAITDGMVLAIYPNGGNSSGIRMGLVVLADNMTFPNVLEISCTQGTHPNSVTTSLVLDPLHTNDFTISDVVVTSNPGSVYVNYAFTPTHLNYGLGVPFVLEYYITKNGAEAGLGTINVTSGTPVSGELVMYDEAEAGDVVVVSIWEQNH